MNFMNLLFQRNCPVAALKIRLNNDSCYITVFDFSSSGRFDKLKIKFAKKKTNQSSHY